MNGNFSFDGETINDGDFNNFYAEFVNMTEGGIQYSSPIGTFAPKGESSPVVDPKKAPKKGGLFKGVGDFIKSDTGRAVLTGVSQGLEAQGVGSGSGGGTEGAPTNTNPQQGMSTGTIIGISIGVLALVGGVIYFVSKK
jgi:hypothetical protein